MKIIALIIPSLSIGGAEKLCISLAEELAKSHTVYLITFGSVVNFRINNIIQHISLHTGTGVASGLLRSFSIILKLRNFLKILRPHGTISFMERSNIFCRIALLGTSIPFIPTVHATVSSFDQRPKISRYFINLFYRFGFPKNFKFITVSPSIRDELIRTYKLDNVTVVYNGIAVNNYVAKTIENKNPFRMLVVARLHPEKQIAIAIICTRMLIDRGIATTLTIIGDGSDRLFLENLVKKLNLHSHVFFLGALENPFDKDIKANCLLVTSRTESFGISIIESILSGIPVVSLNCPTGPMEISTMLSHKGIRLVPYDTNNHEDLASSFTKIIISDFYESNIISCEMAFSIETARRLFSIKLTAECYTSAMEEIIF